MMTIGWSMSESNDYPWYAVGTFTDLRQGDMILGCPLPDLDYGTLRDFVADPKHTGNPGSQITVRIANVVVLTQSCDLVNGKCERVVVCSYGDTSAFPLNKEQRGRVASGQNVALHMLEKCEHKDLAFSQQIVDFRQTFSLPVDYLQAVANERGTRARLLPPYREHLAQRFSNYFMRIGLPGDLTAE